MDYFQDQLFPDLLQTPAQSILDLPTGPDRSETSIILSSNHPFLDAVEGDFDSYDPTAKRTAQLQLHLNRIENSANGLLPPHALWQDDPVPTYSGMLHPYTAYSDYFSLPSVDSNSGDLLLSSSPPPPPPVSDTDGSFSLQANCWDSMPLYSLPGFKKPGGPVCLASEYSVAPSQVQNHPDLQPDLSVPGEYKGDCREYNGDDDGEGDNEDPNRPISDIITDHHLEQTHLPKVGRISHRRKSGRPSLNRIVKPRPSSSSSPPSNKQTTNKDKDTSATRIFTCCFSHYGCTSVFSSKNEWKRHVTTQHLQLEFYRCDSGNCKTSNQTPTFPSNPRVRTRASRYSQQSRANDFNRKDLFTQHQRRMHAPWLRRGTDKPPTEKEREAFEQSLGSVRRRCRHEQRRPPSRSRCGFCDEFFSGPHAWDERMEHVGRHFEKDNPVPQEKMEKEDVYLRDWAIQEGIIQMTDRGKWMLTCLVR